MRYTRNMLVPLILALASFQSGTHLDDGIVELHTGRLIARPLQTLDNRESMSQMIGAYELLKRIKQTDEFVIKVPEGIYEEDLITQLQSTGLFEYVVNDVIVSTSSTVPNDVDYNLQWHHAVLNSPDAWDITTGDSTFIVSTVDVGLNINHPDLIDNLIPGYNSASGVEQINGGDMSPTQADHGTATIGLIGAVGNNLLGATGIAWDISLMPVRATNWQNLAYMSALVDGATWACDNGARVVSMSWHGGQSSSVKILGNYLRSQDSLLVWATGNYGNTVLGHDSADVIYVGATDISDNKAGFSVNGEWVDVVAPGDNVYVPSDNGGYRYWSGTSFATPIVAGILSMMMMVSPSSTAEQIEQMMYLNCVDLMAPGEDIDVGYGRPDFAACLQAAQYAESNYAGHDTIQLSANALDLYPGDLLRLAWSQAPLNSRYRIVYSLIDTSPLIDAWEGIYSAPHYRPRIFGTGTTHGHRGQDFNRLPNGAASGRTFYLEMQCDDNGVLRDSNTIRINVL
jgi:subtilisin family serine protease